MPFSFAIPGGAIGPTVQPIPGGGQPAPGAPLPVDQRPRIDVPDGQIAPPGYVANPSTTVAPGRWTGNTLQTEIGSLVSQRSAAAPYRARYMGQLGNEASRLSRGVANNASMMAALNEQRQGAPVNQRGAVNQALQRMRVRQGVVNRGEEAVRAQALKSRLAAVRQSQSRRGSLQNTLQQAALIRQGVNTGVQDANNRAKASNYEMYGSVAGMAARLAKDYFSKQPWNYGGTDPIAEGTGTADMINMNNPFGTYDYVEAPNPTMVG